MKPLQTRVSTEEYAAILEAAREAGQSVAEWSRRALRAALGPADKPDAAPARKPAHSAIETVKAQLATLPADRARPVVERFAEASEDEAHELTVEPDESTLPNPRYDPRDRRNR